MKFTKTLIVASLMLGTAGIAHAQYGSGTAAKDAVVEKGTEMAKDKAMEMAKDAMGDVATEDKMEMAKKMVIEGKSAEDAAMEMAKEKVMAKGDAMMEKATGSGTTYGSGTDAKDTMMEKADTMMEKADTMMKKETGSATSYGSGATTTTTTTTHGSSSTATTTTHGSATTSTAAPAIACPSGTTAQPDGTCMITGNYVPRG